MNFDVAEIDETSTGTNYNFTIHIVDVNLTTTDAVGFELGPVEHELRTGEVGWPMNINGTEQFVVRFYVRVVCSLLLNKNLRVRLRLRFRRNLGFAIYEYYHLIFKAQSQIVIASAYRTCSLQNYTIKGITRVLTRIFVLADIHSAGVLQTVLFLLEKFTGPQRHLRRPESEQ